MKEKQRYHIGIGVPSILMIFVVLCLTTFGVLSYSSAAADHRLTKKNIEYMKAYYEADAQAQEMLAQIDRALYEAGAAAQENEEYFENVKAALYDMAVILQEDEEELKVSWQIPVAEERELAVIITVYPFERTERYSIEEYCLVQSDGSMASGSIVIEEEGNAGLWQGGN